MEGWKTKQVTKNGKTMNVYVPVVEDRIEQHDLDQMAEGSDFGFKREPKPKSKLSKRDRQEFLEDQKAFNDRKRAGIRKYF